MQQYAVGRNYKAAGRKIRINLKEKYDIIDVQKSIMSVSVNFKRKVICDETTKH